MTITTRVLSGTLLAASLAAPFSAAAQGRQCILSLELSGTSYEAKFLSVEPTSNGQPVVAEGSRTLMEQHGYKKLSPGLTGRFVADNEQATGPFSHKEPNGLVKLVNNILRLKEEAPLQLTYVPAKGRTTAVTVTGWKEGKAAGLCQIFADGRAIAEPMPISDTISWQVDARQLTAAP